MEAVGDASMGDGTAGAGSSAAPNANFLQTLDQIIDLETKETDEQLRAAEAAEAARVAGVKIEPARTRSGKRPHSGSTSSEGLLSSSFLCPILHTRMADPVCTVDGYTFERDAIEKWLSTNDTSPLTGLRLASKTLVPNHLLRQMLDAGGQSTGQ